MGTENKNPCSRCYGTGHLESVVGRRKCDRCNGTGRQIQDRRTFLRGATAMAVGAALAIPALKRPVEVGPIDLSFYLFSEKPYTIPVALMSDESKDIFRLRTLHSGGESSACMPLSKVRSIINSHLKTGLVTAQCKSDGNPVESREMLVGVVRADFILEEAGIAGPPFWMRWSDVRQALFS